MRPSELPIVSEDGPTDGRMTLKQRAAVVALEALKEAGMLDPTDAYPDYKGVVEDGDGWKASFDTYDCIQRSDTRECRYISTFEISLSIRGTVVTGPYGDVLESGDGLIEVVAVTGDITEDQRSRIVGYTSPVKGGKPEYVYLPVVSDTPGSGGSYMVTAVLYWSGPIPADLRSSCHVEAVDRNGKVVFEGRDLDFTTPSTEAARDGASRHALAFDSLRTYIPAEAQGAELRFPCGKWTPVQHYEMPDGPREAMAEGTFPEDERWGVYAGLTWRIEAAKNDQFECAYLTTPESPEGEDHGSMCYPPGNQNKYVIGGSTHTPVVNSDGATTHAFIFGDADSSVALVRFELPEGDVVKVVPVTFPTGYQSTVRFYFALLPISEAAFASGFDRDGNDLGGRKFCFGSRPCTSDIDAEANRPTD